MPLLQEPGSCFLLCGAGSELGPALQSACSHRGWAPTADVSGLGCSEGPRETQSMQGLVEVPRGQKPPALGSALPWSGGLLLSGARVSIGRRRNEVFGGLGVHPVVWEVPDVSAVTSLHSTLSVSFSRFIRRELCFLPTPPGQALLLGAVSTHSGSNLRADRVCADCFIYSCFQGQAPLTGILGKVYSAFSFRRSGR